MLLLFDIDATLLTTSRAGVLAMGDAGREIVGPHFREDGVSYAGRIDPLLIAELLQRHDHCADRDTVARFRARYAQRLEQRLAGQHPAKALPGVLELLDELERRAAATLGLLTGNFEETGRMKLRAASIDPARFAVAAWGDDSPHDPPAREHLPPVAISRCCALGRSVTGAQTVIIGDTPSDVACGLAHGCRVLGVGTGIFSPEDLSRAGAHRAVPDLRETHALADWLLGA